MIECLLSTLIDCVFTSKRACEVLDSLLPGLEESLAAVFYEHFSETLHSTSSSPVTLGEYENNLD